MRRRSIVGPLLLILFGAFLLLLNLRPDWISFRMVATYWPFLLIAWGLLRLVEVVYWYFSAGETPRRGVGGGEWFLVVLICLAGSGLFFFHNRAPELPRVFVGDRTIELFGEVYDYPIAEAQSSAKIARVVVDNPRGSTRIVGADAEGVKVGGRKSIRAYSQKDADAASGRTEVKMTVEGDQLLVRATQDPGSAADLRISTDLEITVPRGVSVQATGRQGDIDITGVNGKVEVTNNNAAVRLQDLGAGARLDLRRSSLVRAVNVKGDIEVLGRGEDVELENVAGQVTINGAYSGDFQFRNLAKPLAFESGVTQLRVAQIPGQFNLTLGDLTAKNVVGPFSLVTRTRDVHLEDVQGPVEIALERGDIRLLPDMARAGRIDAKTGSGDIELAMPAGAAFQLSATTRRGRAVNDYGPPVSAGSDGPGATLKGAAGNGPAISLTTGRGEITVRKR